MMPQVGVYFRFYMKLFRVSNVVHIRNKKFWEELIAYLPWYDTGHIENEASNNSSMSQNVRSYL
jgi:hypothetical protein